MTEKWEGFSQEEIMQVTNPKSNQDPKEISPQLKKAAFKQNNFGKNNIMRERMLKTSIKKSQSQEENDLPQGARLFNPQVPEENRVEAEKGKEERDEKKTELTVKDEIQTPGVPNNNTNLCEESIKQNGNSEMIPIVPLLLPDVSGESLDKFEQRQKMIKEQNRQKKELLKKALEDRTKKDQR